jgi:hypothetical protein
MNHTDTHECANCFHKGALNRHGRCERCDSQAVMSVSLLELLLGPGAGAELEQVTL